MATPEEPTLFDNDPPPNAPAKVEAGKKKRPGEADGQEQQRG